MVASSQEQRAGACDGLPVLDQRAVDELDAPTFSLHRGLDLHRLEQSRAQQVDRESGGLEIGIDTGLLYSPSQQTPDVLTAHYRAPRPLCQPARQIGVAVDSKEGLGHDGGVVDRHRYHDRTPD